MSYLIKILYVIGTQTEPYRNLAIEEELLAHVQPGTAILFLWQNANTIVIGRNQDAEKECRIAKFRKDGGRLARRRSGGGAVYHDSGNLNFSIICHAYQRENYAYQKLIIAALNSFSINAEYNGRNDITVDGKKCSGNAAYGDGDIICQHGTLLISSDIGKMDSLLTPERGKLERNHISSVKSRVVNLHTLNSAITVDTMKQALINAAGAEILQYTPDKDKIDRLTAFYSSEDWIYGGKR